MDSPEFTAAFAAVHRYSLFFLLLMLYSFLGWCGEMVYCSLGQRRLCEKRGFLNDPRLSGLRPRRAAGSVCAERRLHVTGNDLFAGGHFNLSD